VKRLTAPAAVFTYQVGMKYPMPGIAGGRPGAPNRFTLRVGTPRAELVTHTAKMVPLAAGEAYEYRFGGGGGWGDPYARDPRQVLEDVLDEYVSVEGARRDYGVALRGSLAELDLEIDGPETERLRALARAKDAPGTPYGAAPRAAAEASG
jgi:N-methylhydantoinase B